MIKIVAKNVVLEEHIDEFKALAKELVKGSKAEEGCIEYDLFEDVEKPFILTFIETWESMDAIKAHTQTDHYKSVVPQLGKFLVKEKEVHLYKIAD